MMRLKHLLRAAHVKRWGIVNIVGQQNVAEHSFNVACIALHLAESMDWKGRMHDHQKMQLMTWALMHDAVEVFTGDTPTPYKSILREAGANLARAEDIASAEYGECARLVKGTEIDMLVKLADQIESIYFLRDHAIGDHARSVERLLREQLEESVVRYTKEYPDLQVRHAVAQIWKDIL